MTGYNTVLLEPRDNLILPWPLEEPTVFWFGETEDEIEALPNLSSVDFTSVG